VTGRSVLKGSTRRRGCGDSLNVRTLRRLCRRTAAQGRRLLRPLLIWYGLSPISWNVPAAKVAFTRSRVLTSAFRRSSKQHGVPTFEHELCRATHPMPFSLGLCSNVGTDPVQCLLAEAVSECRHRPRALRLAEAVSECRHRPRALRVQLPSQRRYSVQAHRARLRALNR
jgi:hypothetical protein